jgi:DnaB-like helicase C terminal domain
VPTRRPENGLVGVDARLLPESEAIERVADVILIIDRPDQDDLETPRAGEADLRVVKNRYGPERTILTAFQGHYARFVDISANAYPIFPGQKVKTYEDVMGTKPTIDDIKEGDA